MQAGVSSRNAANEKAKSLLDQGAFAEAAAAYLRLSEDFPGNRYYKTAYTGAAIEACRDLPDYSQRREELRDYVLQNVAVGGDDKDRAQALRFLAALGAWREGADLLTQIERQAESPQDIDTCFRFIPRFVEQGSRGALWQSLLTRLRRMRPDLSEERKNEALETELGLLLALERFQPYSALFDKKRQLLAGSGNFKLFEGVRKRLAKPRSEVFAEPKIFGIGLSRTGTTSLASALEILGIDTAHWTNPLTHQVLSDADFFMLGACTDCSVSPHFERLYHLYPNARFIFTQRDADDWAQSFWKHHRRVSWADDMESFRQSFAKRPLADAEIEFALYGEKPDVRDSYRAFEKRVHNFFADKPAGKLLELDISAGQGWNALCAFLGKPVPGVPFPKLNVSQTA